MSILKKLSIGLGSIIGLLLIVVGVVFFEANKIKNAKIVLDDQIELKDYVFKLNTREKDYLLKEDKESEKLVWQIIKKIAHQINNTP